MSVLYFTRVTTAKEPFILGARIAGGTRKGRTRVQRQGVWLGADGQWGRVWNGNLQERVRGFLHPVHIFQGRVDAFFF